MKSYPHVISRLFYEPLLVTHARHAAMVRVLEARMQGAESTEQNSEAQQGEQSWEQAAGWDTAGEDQVIQVHGVLVGKASDIPMSSCGCGLDEVSRQIDEALGDPAVKRLVFDFNSPGGAVTGIPELGRKIAGIVTKETLGFTDSECCSGAVWLAMQCQRFYATQSSAVGSIGVWCAVLDMSRQMEKEGLNMQEISAGKFKTMGAYWKPLAKEERAMLQSQVDKIYGQFKEAVNQRRQIADEFMQGQIFDGEEAVAVGISDGVVESLDEALDGEVR